MDQLDELFDEPTIRIDQALKERIDELRLSGCAQKVAWSKHGIIAYITTDGKGVETRHLMCNPQDGKWHLSAAYSQFIITEAHEGAPLVHLSWSILGAELVVIDAHGRVSFHVVSFAINTLSCLRFATLDQEDDINGVIGFGWLNLDRQSYIYLPVKKNEGDYKYQVISVKAPGPFHPIPGRTAGIGVTRGGVVKLWYQQDHGRYHEVTCELEGLISADDLFSHAAFTSDKDSTMVLAAHTLSGQLRIYRVNLNWQTQQPQSQHVATATLSVQRLRIEDCAAPKSVNGKDTSAARLTRLEFMPLVQGPTPSFELPLVILATYVSLGQQVYTVVSRWELQARQRELNPAFSALSNKTAQPEALQQTELQRLDDIMIDKGVLDVFASFTNTAVAFTCSDGSVQIRDRLKNLAEYPFNNFESMTNLAQAGFEFKPTSDIYKKTCLSPNQCALLGIKSNDDIQLLSCEFQKPVEESDHIGMAAAIAQQFGHGGSNSINLDDILYMIQPYKDDEKFRRTILHECHRSVKFNPDFTNETPNERLFRNPMIQKSLSLQNIIDYKGDGAKKSLSAKTAWILLLIRMSSFAYGSTVNMVARQGQDSEIKAESMEPLVGIARWTLDLFAYLIDGLLELRKAVVGKERDIAFIREKAVELNSPAIFLVLSSGPRILLRYSARGLKALQGETMSRMKSGQPMTDPAMAVLRNFKFVFDSSPVDIGQFERIVNELEGNIRTKYASCAESERQLAERALFVDNQIPPVFQHPVEYLFRSTLDKLWIELDPQALFFHDLTWLGLHDDANTRNFKQKVRIDAIKKTKIPPGADVFRCTRCCSYTEEPKPKSTPHFLGNLTRMCLCGSLWMRPNPAVRRQTNGHE